MFNWLNHEVDDSYDKTYKKLNKLLDESTKIARVGGWEVDLMNNNQPVCSQVTREIHEVPEDYIPDLAEAINFYKEGYDCDLVQRVVSEAMQNGESWDIECRIVTYRKREVWVRSIGRVQMDNGICVRLYGVFQDIDRIKKVEDEKNAISERLKLATTNASIGIWDLDISTGILAWDANMFELYEIKPADFGGTYTSWAKSLTSEDKVHAESNFQRAIQGTGDFDVTFSIKWPDNSQRFIRATAYVLRNKKGQAIRMLGTNWDITEEEQLKRDLRFNNSILEESSASSTFRRL